MKRNFAMLLVLGIVLIFAACGKDGSVTSSGGTQPITQPTQTTAPTEPTVPVPGHDQLLLYVRDADVCLLDCETDTSQVIYTHDEAWTAAQLCDTRNSASAVSDDGGVVYWLMGSGENPDLYCYAAGDEGKQVAANVMDFRASADGQYCIFVNGDRQIWQYDRKEDTQTLISAWCSNEFSMDTWFFAIGGCPDSYLYELENFVYFSDGLALYRIAFGGNREKIANQTWGFDRNYIVSNDLLCYIEYIQEQPLGTVYLWRNGQSQACAEDASYVVQLYPDGSFYYVQGGGVSDQAPVLCYFDGSQSAQLCEFTGRYDFCFSTQIPGGMLFAYETDQVYLVQGTTATQWKENYVNRMCAEDGELWFSTQSGVYRWALSGADAPVLELKDCKIHYQDTVGNLICCSWKDETYVNGLPVGEQSPSDSLFYRNDYQVTFETGHTLVGFTPSGQGKQPMVSYKNSYAFCVLTDGQLSPVDENTVTHFGMENGTVVYLKDMDKDSYCGTLYLYRQGKSVKLAEGVYGLIPCTK